MIDVGISFKLESECIIRDKDGKVKSSLYEINDTLCGFPVLGILELDPLNRIIMHEVRAEMDDGTILRLDLKGG
jgi:hypothetical protein